MRKKDENLEPETLEEVNLDELDQAAGGFFDLFGMLGGIGSLFGGFNSGSSFGSFGGGMPNFGSGTSPGEDRLYAALASQIEQMVANPNLHRRRRRDS